VVDDADMLEFHFPCDLDPSLFAGAGSVALFIALLAVGGQTVMLALRCE
jgi:hypothetical protein